MLLAAVVAVVLLVMLVVALSRIVLIWGTTVEHPWVQKMVSADQRVQVSQAQEEEVQGHLSAMAVRLGELQAQTARLDALSLRLAKSAGLEPEEVKGVEAGQGGAESMFPMESFSATELGSLIDTLTQSVAVQGNRLNVLEGLLVENSTNRYFLPTHLPVNTGWRSSDYGYRADPFTGLKAFHEGIDFSAPVGTTVTAAAAGKVTRSESHSQYGKLVEIDHGNGLTTRYAHNSGLLVKKGDLVMRGQEIAVVGSTGRATGPHLHFEVRLNGVAQNPARFLAARKSGG